MRGEIHTVGTQHFTRFGFHQIDAAFRTHAGKDGFGLFPASGGQLGRHGAGLFQKGGAALAVFHKHAHGADGFIHSPEHGTPCSLRYFRQSGCWGW